MIDFPNTPNPGDEWQPPGSPYTYRWEDPVWTIVGGDPPAGAVGMGGGAAAGGGYEHQLTLPLAGQGDFVTSALLAGYDYEFQFIGSRPSAAGHRHSVQFSDDGGVTWSQAGADYGYQIEGNKSPTGTDFYADVRWENNEGRGYITDEQESAGAMPPSRVSAFIQSHDIATAQTNCFGTCTSYAPTGGPFLVATFYTRLLLERLDNACRFTYVNGAGSRSPYSAGECRIYRRARV